ncbi:hypothetical protein SK128_026930 [Halocaridina rubra]|uniref:Ig-like domain-containing protein n=1 Tax=Halocaridina rubra TaxID=373956 RepID=A0AAN8X5V6_HALRR
MRKSHLKDYKGYSSPAPVFILCCGSPSAIATAPATLDALSFINSTAEGDPGGGEEEATPPDEVKKVFTFIEYITHPPQFVERPEDQRVMNDRVASFTCRATGNPEPRIQWRKNGRKFNQNTRYIVRVPVG